jgi:nucleotide-binding universal stress UspA family protein
MNKKMLVPLDTSEYAECVLSHVKDIATSRAVPEVVLLTVSDMTYAPYADYLDKKVVKQADKLAKETATEYLEKTKQSLGLTKSKVTTVVRSGQPADEILDYIQKNGVDIVVMSSQGKTGVSKWLLGSVAEKVVRNSPVPVYLVPSLACRVAP